MADYQDIRGLRVKYLSADPSNTVGGEVWYNSTTGTLKSQVATTSWSSGAPLTTTREGAAGFGIQTAAVTCGGETPSVTNLTEEYNGSSWTTSPGNMNTARFRVAGAGTLTAGIIFAGHTPPVTTATETYNGTTWTTSPAVLNTARASLAGAGTSTSAVAFGGGPGYLNATESFNGTAWTAKNNLNTARNSLMGAGASNTSVLAFGGETSSPPATATNATESWDGTNWTAVNNLNTARYGAYGAGTQTAAIVAGGIVGPGTMQTATETWDGTNWTTSPVSLATARGRLSMAGTQTAAVASSGQTPSITTATEEYNNSATVITPGAWASQNAMNTGRTYIAGFGTPTTAVAAGGYTTAASALTEEYDGTNWTVGNVIGTARFSLGGCGTLTAGLIAGGGPSTPVKVLTEEYDGTNWTASGALNTGRAELSLFGIQTVAVAAGGGTVGGIKSAVTEEYDGSTWTTSPGSMNTARIQLPSGGAGTLTAGIIYGGNDGLPPAPVATGATETYDGSTWTSLSSLNTAIPGGISALQGTTTAALTGSGGGSLLGVEGYDGTSWSTRPSLAGVHGYGSGVGTQTTAMCFGGGPGTVATTELFTGETSAANIETLTTS